MNASAVRRSQATNLGLPREPRSHRFELLVVDLAPGVAALEDSQRVLVPVRRGRSRVLRAAVAVEQGVDTPDDQAPEHDHPDPAEGDPPAPTVSHVPHGCYPPRIGVRRISPAPSLANPACYSTISLPRNMPIWQPNSYSPAFSGTNSTGT